MTKKVMAIFLLTLMLVSSIAFPANAQTSFWLGDNSFSYNNNRYSTCKLANPGKKMHLLRLHWFQQVRLQLK